MRILLLSLIALLASCNDHYTENCTLGDGLIIADYSTPDEIYKACDGVSLRGCYYYRPGLSVLVYLKYDLETLKAELRHHGCGEIDEDIYQAHVKHGQRLFLNQ